MRESVLLDLREGRLDAFQAAIAGWRDFVTRDEGSAAAASREAEGVVSEALQIPAVVQALWESTLDLVPFGGVADYQKTGERLFGSFAKALAILRETQALANALADRGQPIANAGQLTDALCQLEQLKDQVFEFWPDPAAAAKGLVEHERGEALELANAFAGIAGLSRDEWLRRVESHKRSRAS